MLSAGQRVLHYRLDEKIGEGGMGVVWKATDTTLDRAVAVKVLPPAFAADPDRLSRFEREARLLASLNHPNIATVFSVHLVEGDRFLTMELVPGEDLAQRIARGALPVAEALDIARQIALALEAAHESGVVHRDLKPANVRVTPDGRVKVLDFGLAKAMEASPGSAVLSQSPTFAASAMSGMIVGTAAYMAPEQARGQTVDRRADIWAFGVVLYEMLTGQRAFTGDTVSDILAAVLRAEPERAALPKDLPPAVRALLERCLEKNPRRRLRDIGEALLVLEDVQAGRAPATFEPAPAPPAKGPAPLLWIGALVAVAAVAVVATLLLRPPPRTPALRKYTLALKDSGDEVISPIVSPSGRQIAYMENRRLWIRDLGQIASRALADGLDEDFRPLWSPDGSFIVFATSDGLSRVDVAGGAIAPICTVGDFTGGSGATWDPDGHIDFTRGHDHIYQVAAGGGVPSVRVARIDSLEGDLHHPFALPGGHGILCVRHMLQGGPNILAVASPGKRHDLLTLVSGFIWEPVYDPRGYVIFSRIGEGAGLWALPFSLDRQAVTGEAFLIAPEGASPSVAADGALVYRLGTTSVEARVVAVDRSGAARDTLTEARRGIWAVALSPDEKQLAMEVRESGEGDVWLYDLERRAQTRFAFGTNRQSSPAWSPDGREIAYEDAATSQEMVKATDGSQAPRALARGFMAQYTPDGRHVVYSTNGRDGTPDIVYASPGGADSATVVQTPGADVFPMPAPQGDYLLYASSESGRSEVYLRQFPSGEGRWQVSTNGAIKAVWSRKGDRIYYWSGEDIFEVPVELKPVVHLGASHVLFNLATIKAQTFGRWNFVPTSDPDRFLVLKPTERATPSHTDAIVIENWPAEFEKKQ